MLDKYFQEGKGKGKKILIVGESVAARGWGSGKACYTKEGKLLATGRRLNELLKRFDLSVETCSFTELVKCCLGKNRKLLAKQAVKYWPVFLRQVRRLDPKLIITLGIETLRIFNNLAEGKAEVGKMSKVKLRGKSYQVLPIWHPSPRSPWGKKKNEEIFKRYRKEVILVLRESDQDPQRKALMGRCQ